MNSLLEIRSSALALVLLALAGCGGGENSISGGGTTVNRIPTASAGPDQNVTESSAVSLDGRGSSDPDNDPLSYAWAQTAGPAVSLTGANTAQPGFTAPAVAAGSTQSLTFELTVNDGAATDTDSVVVTVAEAQSAVTVAGKLEYEFVPPNNNCRGLNFNAIQSRPIRGATVQLVDGNNDSNVLGTTRTDDSGDYSFSNVDANTDVRIRVRAELKQSGSPGWDVEVRDNTSQTASPLAQRPLYVVQWASFDTGSADINDADFTATTGWGGSSYTGTRSAAPLAILDQIYSGIQAIVAERSTEVFPPLDAFWSVNNTLTSPSDIDAGELTASFYRSDIDSLFLLGDANVDTEEFDDHVTMHEWGHYFEDVFSRSDSTGGSHTIGESLDPRLAFGEGFATALAAIVLNEQQYCDTSVVGTNGGFGLSTENEDGGVQGWMNEMSVATFIYDLWDTDVDGSDNRSIGFGHILNTMMGPQASTPSFTSLFSFATELRTMLAGADLAFVDSQLARENIDAANITIWGDTQSTIPSGARNGGRDILPMSVEIPPGGSIVRACTNNDYTVADFTEPSSVNKLGDYRFLHFDVPRGGSWTLTVAANPAPPPTNDVPGPDPNDPDAVRDRSDPDLYLYRQGNLIASSTEGTADLEVFNMNLPDEGTYVVEFEEWRFHDTNISSDFPSQVCYDITLQ